MLTDLVLFMMPLKQINVKVMREYCEMKELITVDDFEQVSWQEYQEAALRIAKDIDAFCTENKINIDSIIPIMRGGGVLAIHLSHLLHIYRLSPCQYKYTEIGGHYAPKCLYESDLSQLVLIDRCFLVVEGNHASGGTAQMCIDNVLQYVPDAKILYCALSRDASRIEKMKGVLYETYGMLSNELRTYSKEYCRNHGIRYKLTVFPWETIEEEYQEVIDSQAYLAL